MFEQKDPDRILFVSPGGIGNLVLALPALRSLRAAFPIAGITLLTAEPGVHHLCDNEGLITDHYCYDRAALQGPMALGRFLRDMRVRRYDLALTAGTVDPVSAGLLMFLAGIPCRAGEDIGGRGWFYNVKASFIPGCHERDGALNILEKLGVEPAGLLPALHLTAEEKISADVFLREKGFREEDVLVGMHAGSGSCGQAFRKRWPAGHFSELIRAVTARGGKVVLTCGPSEKDLVQKISGAAGPGVFTTEGRLTLRQTAALITRCRAFVANDSGIAHVAAAVATPLVVLFGPSDPARVAPRGAGRITVIESDGPGRAMTAIPVDRVRAAVEALWPL